MSANKYFKPLDTTPLAMHSFSMYRDTEKPGELFPVETHQIIRKRYEIAGEISKGKKLLEVGCGSGFGVEYLGNKSLSYTGIDYSQENISSLKKLYGDTSNIFQADAHKVDLPDSEFDVIVALAMIYYLDIDAFLSEANRLLKTGGTLFFCTTNKDVPGFFRADFTTDYYSIPELFKHLKSAGFEAKFEGAFPTPGANLFLRKSKAIIKNFIKSIFYLIPKGKNIWSSLRKKSLSNIEPIPDKIELMKEYKNSNMPLGANKPNYDYRVIYIKAKKLSDY